MDPETPRAKLPRGQSARYTAAGLLVGENTAEFVHLFERQTGAAGDAGQRVVGGGRGEHGAQT